MTTGQPIPWKPVNQPQVLKNSQCVYCGCTFGKETKFNTDHVIGKNVVPWNSFAANDWNLFVRSCLACNNRKSALENEISAITLQSGIGQKHADAELEEAARRKARKAPSTATGKLVKDSVGSETIAGNLFPEASISFGFVVPVQLSPTSVSHLAWAHVTAFFYAITYNERTRRSGWPPGPLTWMHFGPSSDWGSLLFASFADRTKLWLPRVLGNAAKGYFRIVMKRKDEQTLLWSFALEWNKSYRVIGFFGDKDATDQAVDALTFDPMFQVGSRQRYREEVPLTTAADPLFECHWPDGSADVGDQIH